MDAHTQLKSVSVLKASATVFFSSWIVTWWNVKMWPFATRVLHSRSPSVRLSLLHHGQGFISGHRQLEGESWGRGRGYSHCSSAEQNWPAGTDRCKEVSSCCCCCFYQNKKSTQRKLTCSLCSCHIPARRQKLWPKGWSWGFIELQWKRTSTSTRVSYCWSGLMINCTLFV